VFFDLERIRWRLGVALLLGCFGLPDAAFAFSPKTRVEIIERAARLMPPALGRQLAKHRKSLLAGALEPLMHTEMSALGANEKLECVDASVQALVEAMEEQQPMKNVARIFGRIAFESANLSFGLNTRQDDPREERIYLEFTRYVEAKLPKIKTTFGGFADPALHAQDPEKFCEEIASRARRDYDGILRSYFPEGRKSGVADFDDRSVAFATASLEVSLAVTATARAWLFAWHRAHGDLHGTPLLDPSAIRTPFASIEPATRSKQLETRP